MPEEKLNINGEQTFQNIDYKNKTVSLPTPDKITDIDTRGEFYQHLMDAADNGVLNMSTINSFTSITRARDQVYSLLDVMSEDSMISSALKIYASDICETSDAGRIVWCESDDERIQGAVESILDSLNIEKNSYGWVYSLIKYGDLYLRLFRESDFYMFDKFMKKFQDKESDQLNEDVIIKAYSKNDRYANYIEMVKNPAQVFDLVKYGKSYGYIKTKVQTSRLRNDVLAPRSDQQWMYRFDTGDVEVYGATEFAHACLSDTSDRIDEEVTLTSDGDEENQVTFNVRRGQSLLYNSYRIWRELNLLENAILLNRITQSSVIRTVNVEVPDDDPVAAKAILRRVKSMFEQKAAIQVGTSMTEYANAGPVQNTIYIPTHGGIGNVSISDAGGKFDPGDLTDLDYWKTKLAGSIGIPKQYLGDTDDSTGFNGGSSLSLISSRYAKTVKFIQNIYIQVITDVVNIILLSRGLKKYINNFTLKMQAPTTQEEKSRKDNLSKDINNISQIMNLLGDIQNPKAKLRIVKLLLSHIVTDAKVLSIIQEEIDNMNNTDPMVSGEESDDLGGFGGGGHGLGGGPSGGGLPSPDEILDVADDAADAAEKAEGGEKSSEPPAGEESFYNRNGGRTINERDDLPSFADLGISYENIH